MPKDILELEDVKLLVYTFYAKVREDVLLKDVFNDVIQERWPEHLERMVAFWQTVLLGEHTYYGSPFPPHAKLPVTQDHFDRWLSLFHETVNTLFLGEKASEAMWRAEKMATMFQYKLQAIRENKNSFSIK